MASVFNFIVDNKDLEIRFSCPNHKLRIEQIVRNLCIDIDDEESYAKKICRFTILDGEATFIFNGISEYGQDIRHEAVFFENTDYPILVRATKGKELEDVYLSINDHLKSDNERKNTIIGEGGELYGSLNFHNQVGMTDFSLTYKVKGENHFKKLKFMTEVLSYKLDYRSDLRTIITDIENEYALLCTSFLKDTYLSMRQNHGESNSLIWWQIFKSCYKEIINATKLIIGRPKRKLRSVAKYDRAERLSVLPFDMENEYQLHKDNPAYLYRTEEQILSNDTIENRFLKYAINEMHHRFVEIKEHIITAMHLDNPLCIDNSITEMENEMLQLKNHIFFRGIGVFKGFTQDNLVMKQALGYRTIMEKWVELKQGYELEEGMRKLEVKDISDLYEIWCFIKVKNIVQDTLSDLGKETSIMTNGNSITKDFIPKLVYGGEMCFIDDNGIELASVSYNAQIEKENTQRESAITGTSTITTVQRPDIALRLSKTDDIGMKYTYLFDAKYRIDDKCDPHGYDFPPEDAIDQMHRYRDAIYYTEEGSDHAHLKKEIIAGYVLFPGRIPLDALNLDTGDYYYQQSNRKIGIGAFPLRPDQENHSKDGRILIDINSSENALRNQIRKWLEEDNSREKLLEQSIPQKGLEYSDEPVTKGTYFLSSIDMHVNSNVREILDGVSKTFYSGYSAILQGIDFQKIKYLVPVNNHLIHGFYKVIRIDVKDMSESLRKDKERRVNKGQKVNWYKGFDQPIRIHFELGEYVSLPKPFVYGLDFNAARGIVLTRKEFYEYSKQYQ